MIIVYSQPDCRPCKRVISKLEDESVEFEVVDISEDQTAWQFVTEMLGARSTPVIDSEFGPILGYDPDKLKQLITWYKEN
jgi:glutaredoxin-like protein NrdH